MEDIKEVVWGWNFGVYMPFCPYCNEPIYEAGTCIFCDKPHKWREGKHKETVVGKPVVYTGIYCEDKEKMRKFLNDCLELIEE